MHDENGNGQLQTIPAVPVGLGDDQLLAVAAAAEKRIEAVNKIKKIALKVTNHRDWRDQGGNPYLQVSGAEKVARLFGISWRIDEPTREEHADGHFSYTVKGYFVMGTAEIEVLGTRSSTDPLFARKSGEDVPPSEIDRNDVKKSAVTNCLGNGITRLLGIRNLTWDDLKEAGLSQGSIGKTEYATSDPNASMKLPNYGRSKGKSMDDPTVTLDELRYYLSGAEKSIADPEKAKFRAKEEKLRDALMVEIAKREAGPGPSPAPAASSPGADHSPATGAGDGGSVTPQTLAERMELAESVAELSGLMNKVLKTEMSDEDRATLKAVCKQNLARFRKK